MPRGLIETLTREVASWLNFAFLSTPQSPPPTHNVLLNSQNFKSCVQKGRRAVQWTVCSNCANMYNILQTSNYRQMRLAHSSHIGNIVKHSHVFDNKPKWLMLQRGWIKFVFWQKSCSQFNANNFHQMCFLLHCHLDEKAPWQIAKSPPNGNLRNQPSLLYLNIKVWLILS